MLKSIFQFWAMSVSEMNFDRLYQFFCKVPSVQESRIVAHGTDGQHAWWFKFQY